MVDQPCNLANVKLSGQATNAIDGSTVVSAGYLIGGVVAVGVGDDD